METLKEVDSIEYEILKENMAKAETEVERQAIRNSDRAAASLGALYTDLKSEENFFRSFNIPSQNLLVSLAPTVMLRISL